ncbi:MAG: DedA family protein [Rhizobiales bacterium]|nr:DedA family protein [Hyphomicrobiales bacterium]
MLRALYDRCMALAAHRLAGLWLAVVSFAESSFFPIPPDVMLIPMVVAQRAKAWFYAAICTVASVAGGLLGYLIGASLLYVVGDVLLDVFDPKWRLDEPGHPAFDPATYDAANPQSAWGRFRQLYAEWGFWIVFAAGFTPLPYKVFTIASGAVGLSLPVFVAASLISRGGRFFLVAALLYLFGPPVRAFIEKRLGLMTAIFFIFLIGGFLVLRYMH